MFRTARVTRAPTRANSRAVTAPRPLLAPVMMTVRPANEGRSAAVQVVMADTLMNHPTKPGWLLGRHGETGDDRLDLVGVGDGLFGQAGDGELYQVTLLAGGEPVGMTIRLYPCSRVPLIS